MSKIAVLKKFRGKFVKKTEGKSTDGEKVVFHEMRKDFGPVVYEQFLTDSIKSEMLEMVGEDEVDNVEVPYCSPCKRIGLSGEGLDEKYCSECGNSMGIKKSTGINEKIVNYALAEIRKKIEEWG